MSDKPRFMQRLREPVARARRSMRDGARQRAESLFVLDREVGHMVHTLKRSGEWRHTVLMFTSDNGFFLGEHRKKAGKILGYEPSIRVPFLVTGPGMRSGEHRYDPITLVDQTATILDLAGATHRLASRHPIDGVSRLPTMLGGDQGWTVPVLTEGHIWRKVRKKTADRLGFKGIGRSYFGIRTAQYSLIRTIRGTLELYDLADDANEMKSRHDDPSYRPVKQELLDVWRSYLDCRGSECVSPLPGDLQASPSAERDLTVSFWDQVNQVHGY
jgi:arylsulfatase A-like enzyme